MSDFLEKVGLYMVGKVGWPVLLWTGSRVAGPLLSGGPVGPVRGILLSTAAIGTTIVVAAKPEEALDFVLRGIATTANVTSQVLGVAANQIRALEKVDLEKIMNKPFEYFNSNSPNDSKGGPGGPPGPLQIAPPPPLVPKDYTLSNFPYFLTGPALFLNNPDVDPYLQAYYNLDIDIVSMILADHQLPQLELVRDIYVQRIRQNHPDKGGSSATAAKLNDSYATIKALMQSPDDQFDLIQPVLQYFHKSSFPPTPYIILFCAGGFLSILLLR